MNRRDLAARPSRTFSVTAAGWDWKRATPVVDVGTRRIYSNYGVDLATRSILGEHDAESWLAHRLFTPFGMSATRSRDVHRRASSGQPTTSFEWRVAWLRPDGISQETRDYLICSLRAATQWHAFLVLDASRPCPWGLGPEVQGEKHHWMGTGRRRVLGTSERVALYSCSNADEQIAVVATSTEPFGGWAVTLWPEWTSAMRKLALA